MGFLDFLSKKQACEFLVNVDGQAVKKYNYFKDFLQHNRDALNSMAEMEQLSYEGHFNMPLVQQKCQDLLVSTRQLVQALDGLGGGRYAELSSVCDQLEKAIAPHLHYGPCCRLGDLVLPLEAVTPDMVRETGSKAMNLAIIGNVLEMPVPPGFVITSCAFERFLEENHLAQSISEILAGLSPDNFAELEDHSARLQEMVRNAPVPQSLAAKILSAYEALEGKTSKNVRIAMRSSAVGEDTEASFAGQYITVLNVTRDGILEAYKAVLASKYAPRAILYRLRCGLDDRETPMCVAGITMVDSQASGVMYTVDPTDAASNLLKINSIWGLGEHLVGGEASPDEYYVEKSTAAIVEKVIHRKEQRLINLAEGGIRLEDIPPGEQDLPSLADQSVQTLARYGLLLENHFQGPQDVEWAVDPAGKLFILQSRPLGLVHTKDQPEAVEVDPERYPVRLNAGKTASPGIAAGTAYVVKGRGADNPPEDAILVARTASPDLAGLMDRVKGIITDIGSVTSHLASVAREFGVPALVDTGQATALLADGEPITLVAEAQTVYQGIVPELAAIAKPMKKLIFESPVNLRLRAVLDVVSPLNLTDPKSPDFSPAGCRTVHDVIRFSHENAMKEMFGLSEATRGSVTSMKLTSNIPLLLYFIDLGGGLRAGLTTCDVITPDHLESIPMKALWRGFSHPGITWKGSVSFDMGTFMSLMAAGATAEAGGGLPGGNSYAIISREYVNLSAKFGYHYANLDTFVSPEPDQNYLTLQFAGGVGSYYGRSLRLNFLGNVLFILGFNINVTGDLLEASLTGLDLPAMEKTLDQVGRLLASSRLLDMAITNESDVNRMVEAFFKGDYDFLGAAEENRLPNFYTHVGDWHRVEEDGQLLLLQDGSEYGSSLSSGMANVMGKMVGAKYQEVLG